MENVIILLLVFALICVFAMLNKSKSQKMSEGFRYYSTIPSNCVEDIHGNIKCYPAYYFSPLHNPWPRYRRYPYRHRRGWRSWW